VIGAVHASIGAAIGSLVKDKRGAFVSGVASHVVADALPHTDFPPKVEVAFLAGALVGIAAWRGVDSPEFWGALGAVAPDAEHALLAADLIAPENEVFPTHLRDGAFHGPDSRERWSQALIALAAVTVMLRTGRK